MPILCPISSLKDTEIYLEAQLVMCKGVIIR